MADNFQVIIFSPFANNVLDYVTSPNLYARDGRSVKIMRGNVDFIVSVEGQKPFTTPSNIEASRYLNSFEVGIFTA